ncbi:hypothetical protein GCM10010315_43090 [Streptomyces luteosporeus]|uniref:Uncharacterized protein n=1 Tax=Streptomyces luteosporeus TaxID=173856 RepID=A0ABP6GGC4_9ACTN
MLASIDAKPYTAFVVCPAEVVKFSAGSAKNARYAMECPSINSRRRRPPSTAPVPVVSFASSALDAVFAAFAATHPILPRPTDKPDRRTDRAGHRRPPSPSRTPPP